MNAPLIGGQPSPNNMQRRIGAEEAARDLRVQLSGLGAEDEGEIQFIEWSPGRRMVTIWSREDGSEATLPFYIARSALNTPSLRGGWRWTTHRHECDCGQCDEQQRAPKARVNSVKCFLHPEAPERALLDEMGITQVCMSGQLASESSKRQHAKRHASSWAQYQEEVERREKDAAKADQKEQTAAILKLANRKGTE